MLELIQLQNIKIEIHQQTILEDIDANVHQGDIIGIIGKNGAGKSTLLQVLNEDIHPSEGQIKHLEDHLRITMVEQETESYHFAEVSSLEASLLKKWQVPSRKYSELSGGEKLKARLARGLAQDTDLLLLDEPTNHLDESSLRFLIKQLQSFKGTIILVSHDRYFLDEVVTKIWSLENKTLLSHSGSYTSYIEFREAKRLAQQREYEKQQKMKERVEDQMSQLTSWSKSAHAQSTKQDGAKEYYRKKAKRMDAQVKSKQKRLEKELEKINADAPASEDEVNFSLQANAKKGKRFLEVKDVEKSFEGGTLFKSPGFTIQHGEKVAITGANGSGKTTFLKMIKGIEPVSKGEIWVSPSANIGYLTQEVFDLPLDQTPEQLFDKETFQERGHVRNLLKHLGFSEVQWTEPIASMSMGERVKCKLMKYILEEKDVLLLDEPTNHLDLPSREQLETTLTEYQGTLLIVSHDRYLLEKTTNTKLIISNQTMKKQWKEEESFKKLDEQEELRLTLETERQEVLGRLSLITPGSKGYEELDHKFKELTQSINEIKKGEERD